MSTGPVELQGITINAGILETLQGFSTQRNVLKGITIAVGTGASIMQLKVVDRNHEPIEGATCRVLNAISGSNNVLSFDGVDDRIIIPHDISLNCTNAVSISAWIKKATTSRQTIIGKDYRDFEITYELFGGQTRFLIFWGNGSSFKSVTPSYANDLNDNVWRHIAVTINKATGDVVIYINGSSIYSGNGGAQTGAGTFNLYIGTRTTTQHWNGSISNVRLFNSVLSPSDVTNIYNNEIPEIGLIGSWLLDEGTGSTATDSAGNNDGTIYGATWAEVEDLPILNFKGQYDTTTPYDSQTTNANGLTTLNYQINKIHGLEVTLPGKRRFIMPFKRTTRGLLDWQVMLSDYLATFATDRGNILINSEPENNDSNFLIE